MLQPAFFRFTEQANQDIRNNQIQYGGNTEGGKRLIRCRVDIAGDLQQIREAAPVTTADFPNKRFAIIVTSLSFIVLRIWPNIHRHPRLHF